MARTKEKENYIVIYDDPRAILCATMEDALDEIDELLERGYGAEEMAIFKTTEAWAIRANKVATEKVGLEDFDREFRIA